MIPKASTAAWCHVHMKGHCTFPGNGQLIALNMIVVGLDLAWRNFRRFGLTPPEEAGVESVASSASRFVLVSPEATLDSAGAVFELVLDRGRA